MSSKHSGKNRGHFHSFQWSMDEMVPNTGSKWAKQGQTAAYFSSFSGWLIDSCHFYSSVTFTLCFDIWKGHMRIQDKKCQAWSLFLSCPSVWVAALLVFQLSLWCIKHLLTEVVLLTVKVERCAATRALVSCCTSNVKQHSLFAVLYFKYVWLWNIVHSVSSPDLNLCTTLTLCFYFRAKQQTFKIILPHWRHNSNL